MSFTLEQIKSAFKKPESEGNSLPNNYYPFWEMKDGETAIVRFLPDSNPDNPFGFLVEKQMHTLTINGERKSVPCLRMYDENCPICKVSAEFYKKEDKVNGKLYWRKKQHIGQALIVEDPLPADEATGETHAGKVRYITLGYQIYNIIKEAFESGELEEVPFAFKGGCDFKIKKSKQGEYSTYALGSQFARKSSDLSEDVIAQIQDQLIDLKTLLPKHPGVEKVEAMLSAALSGGSYEGGSSEADADEDDETPVRTPSKPATTSVASTATESVDSGDDNTDEILAAIRARRQKTAQ